MKLATHFHKGCLNTFVVSDAKVKIFSCFEAGEDR